MNNLSILLYLADVAGNIGWIFNMLFAISIFSVLVTLVVGGAMAEGTPSEKDWKIWRRWLISSIGLFFSASLASALTPSKETVYAIAASETGEEVLNSGVETRATKALEAWLDKQIEEQTKEPTSE